MRSWMSPFIFVAALFALTAGAQAEKRVALVIGNSAYQNTAPLKNPRSDAEDMAAALKRLDFEVVAGYDLDDRGMKTKVRDFARAVDGADTALFFYAGHGVQSKGENYLLPVNASLRTESDLDFETVSLDLVMKQMQRSARVSLVFLDACRDNPLTRSLRTASRSAAVGNGLARIEEAAGMMISFSTQPGNVALDGTGRNSPYTKALLSHIDTPGATIGDVMIDVRKQVIAETKERQIPWENSSLTGKFYFRPAAQQVAGREPGCQAGRAGQAGPHRARGDARPYLLDVHRRVGRPGALSRLPAAIPHRHVRVDCGGQAAGAVARAGVAAGRRQHQDGHGHRHGRGSAQHRKPPAGGPGHAARAPARRLLLGPNRRGLGSPVAPGSRALQRGGETRAAARCPEPTGRDQGQEFCWPCVRAGSVAGTRSASSRAVR